MRMLTRACIVNVWLFVGGLQIGAAVTSFSLAVPDPATGTGSALQTTYDEYKRTIQTRRQLENQVDQLKATLLQQLMAINHLQNTSNTLIDPMHFHRPTEPVAFQGKLGSNLHGNRMSEVIAFDDVTTNLQWAYSPADHSFHCNHNGLYLFAITLYAQAPRQQCSVDVYWNGIVIARPTVDVSDDIIATHEVAVVKTRRGDQVRVKWSYFHDCTLTHSTRFSAVLIHDFDS